MKPEDRENQRYSAGAKNPIGIEEEVMFSLLHDASKEDKRNLLDVGCGIGSISEELQKRGFKVTGIDFSSVAIEKCKERGIKAYLSDVDRDGLKFPDNFFDIVWVGDVIEHVFDPINLLEEIERVLKSNGYVLCTIPNDFNIFTRMKIFLTGKSIQSDIYRRLRQCKHHTFFSYDLLKFMIDESGLYVEKIMAVANLPKRKIHLLLKHRFWITLFGSVFIIRAYKKK